MVFHTARKQPHTRTLRRNAQRGVQHLVLALQHRRTAGKRLAGMPGHGREDNGHMQGVGKRNRRDGEPLQERPHAGRMVPARRAYGARLCRTARVPRPRVQRRHHAHRLPQPAAEHCESKRPWHEGLRGIRAKVRRRSGAAADFLRLLPHSGRRRKDTRAPAVL